MNDSYGKALGAPPPRPELFQTKEGMDWMLRAVAKADQVDANYEARHGDLKKLRAQRKKDFIEFCHAVMYDARRKNRIGKFTSGT